MNVHMRKQHSLLEKAIKCRFCDEVYFDRWNLMQHQKTHRMENRMLRPNVTKLKKTETGNFVVDESMASTIAESAQPNNSQNFKDNISSAENKENLINAQQQNTPIPNQNQHNP